MITLEFTIEELKVIDTALQEMPYKMVAPVISSINKQILAAHHVDGNNNEQEES